MSTAAMSWMATAVTMPFQLEDVASASAEKSKQITKSLKCVAFTNMQVGAMMERKRGRLQNRIKAVSGEIQLLETDMLENERNAELRRAQLTDIEDDIHQAHALGNSPMVQELVDELKILQEEDTREEVLFRNLRKTVRARRRVRKQFLAEKQAVEEAMAAFSIKQNLIQSLLTSISKKSASAGTTQSSSASESECGSSDRSEDSLELDLEIAKSSEPREPPSLSKEPVRSSLRSTNSDTDSQSSSTTKRSRSVSFSPLPPSQFGVPDDDGEPAVSAAQLQQRRAASTHVEELSDSEDDADDELESTSSVSTHSSDDDSCVGAGRGKTSPIRVPLSPRLRSSRRTPIIPRVSIEEAALASVKYSSRRALVPTDELAEAP